MRVALVHDYLTQRGGAERVLLALSAIFPDAPIFTSVYAADQTFDEFSHLDIRSSPLQRLSLYRHDPRYALPLLSASFRLLDFRSYDAVVVSTSGWAHRVTLPADMPRLIYCHNPPRWLYQEEDYPLPKPLRIGRPWINSLKRSDRAAALSHKGSYVANSTTVRDRIGRCYGMESEVIFPPMMLNHAGPDEPVPCAPRDFWLTVALNRCYKNLQAVIDGVELVESENLIVVGGASDQRKSASQSVLFAGSVTEAQLRWLYRNAKGLITVSFEDFGLTPIEAHAFGTPVLALRRGGHLDTVIEGVSGRWIEESSADAVAPAVRTFSPIAPELVRSHAAQFSFEHFKRQIIGRLRSQMH